MARTDPQVNFRIPAPLKDAIEAAAAASNRTVTAEIVSRLDESFTRSHAAQLETWGELNSLRAQVESYKMAIQMMEITQGLLAGSLVQAIDRMPSPLRDHHGTIRSLAEAIDKKDSRGIGMAFMEICRSDKEAFVDLQELMVEMEPVFAAKDRGEDLTPYKEAHLLREMNKLDARLLPPKATEEPAPKKKRAVKIDLGGVKEQPSQKK
jgi:hypothetical protein